ncbi:MAG: protein kinase, partial [Chloroflexi bacterium]|nr:protein kinase [Chloroflexota bacterium]
MVENKDQARRIGKYAILEELDGDGLTRVYRTFDPSSSQMVALKVLGEELAADFSFSQGFEASAEAIAGVDHPNLVRIFTVGKHEGAPYVAQEFLSDDLGAIVNLAEPIKFERAVELGKQILAGLAAAHAVEVLHCTLKPSNVLIGTDGQAKLVDFGMIRTADISTAIDRGGDQARMLQYISPEQARDFAVDARTDVYGAGCLLYHLFTGKAPFEGLDPGPVVRSQIGDDPTRPVEIHTDLPERISDLIMVALAKDPAQRFQSVVDMAAALDGAIIAINEPETDPGKRKKRRGAADPQGPKPKFKGGIAYVMPAGEWQTGQPLAAARAEHTATTLRDGRVLVVGGQRDAGTAEIFDAFENRWGSAGSISHPRTRHTAILLSDGKVLIAGGYKNLEPFGGCEIYDPESNNWSSAPEMLVVRAGHTAALMRDGKVLVAGGYGANGIEASAELFDPRTSEWTRVGSMVSQRAEAVMIGLPSGNAVVFGGLGEDGREASVEIFKPVTNSWAPGEPMKVARSRHTVSVLHNGRLLVVGGEDEDGDPVSAAAIFDPFRGTWTNAGELTDPRSQHSATVLPDGRVVVTGGMDEEVQLLSTEIYDPASNLWSLAASPESAPLWHTSSLLADGRVLLSGGYVD